MRIAGKTTVGTARVFDFVSTVVMGTMIGSTIVSRSIALTTGLVGLTALVALQWVVVHASSRSPRVYRLATNTPRLLYTGSRFLEENLMAERITREDVLAKVREGGYPRAPPTRKEHTIPLRFLNRNLTPNPYAGERSSRTAFPGSGERERKRRWSGSRDGRP